MPVSEKLLAILVCPENHTSLRPAEQTLIDALNQRVEQRSLRNRAGALVLDRFDGGLIREDGRYLYVIREDIPIMLIDESIPL